ncbi:MAG: twin-arginine translocase subunit TatC [Deltaproteobacteria bacterium]|nr:twin-arginine translocase subunit TatC [Deltaproteobacteria bacterium]MBW2071020.1 twin-arginine translocase subunit TatC [Deltaproteobacteria bacterium]
MAENETLDDKMPFTEHLEELRQRLIVCFVAIGVGFVICYFFAKQLFAILMRPLIQVMPAGDKLIFTALPEAFFTYLKVAFLAGVGLATPVIIYEFWRFIAPGLYQKERRALLPIVLFSTFFFVGGALFGYFVVFPFGFKFFIGFASENIKALPSIREYLSFAAKLLFAFGLIFELPLFTFFLARLGLVDAKLLRSKQKYAILIIFVVAAILTPPDVVTQIMMSGPLILLYELSIWIARIFGKKSPAAEEKEEPAA